MKTTLRLRLANRQRLFIRQALFFFLFVTVLAATLYFLINSPA